MIKSLNLHSQVSGNKFLEISSIIIVAIQLAIFCLKINDNFYGSDFENYWQGAQSILNGSVYSTHGSNLVPDSFRPFGYPLVIAIFLVLFGESYQYFLIGFQAFLCLLMLVITFNLLKKVRLFNAVSILIVTTLYSHPTWLYTATQMQCDIFVAFFAFLYIYYVIVFYIEKKYFHLYMAVAILSVSLYFRPFYLYFVPLLILGIAIWIRAKVAIIATLIFIMTIAPWVTRNKLVLDSYKFSMLGDIALAYIAGDTIRHAKGMEQNQAYYYVLRESGVGEEFEKNKQDNNIYEKLRSYSVGVIIQNPVAVVQASIRGLVRVFTMPHEIYQLQKNTTIPIDKFIEILRTRPQELLSNINSYFIYLYVFPYLINTVILIGIGVFLLNIWRWLPQNLYLIISALPMFLYGWIIPGPINKSHYITLYYLAVVLLVIFSVNKLRNKNLLDL